MSLVVTPPTKADTRCLLADWIELQAIRDLSRKSIGSVLSNPLDIADDLFSEDLEVWDEQAKEFVDESILDEKREELVDAAFEEIIFRQQTLGVCYPFEIDPRQATIQFNGAVLASNVGALVYTTCLMVSAMRTEQIEITAEHEGLIEDLAEIFQICACLAAGGFTGGQVVSFGFPRPDGTGFLEALRTTYTRFRSGKVKPAVPIGISPFVKDYGVDVIAWRDQPDGLPGKLYLLGQCASGKNWLGKALKGDIEGFHGTWFDEQPATICLPSMFIPFVSYSEQNESGNFAFVDGIRNFLWSKEMHFGLIFDRSRVAYHADRLFMAPAVEREQVYGSDKLDVLRDWIQDTVAVLRLSV